MNYIKIDDAKNPYSDLPPSAFWKTAIAQRNVEDLEQLWKPKFQLSRELRYATAGSCFSQEISKYFKENGFHWLQAERGLPGVPESIQKSYNYGIFSFRTGNIYTARLLRQWLTWAMRLRNPPEEVWEDAPGVFKDPFRPAIEPNGYPTREDVLASRAHALRTIRMTLPKIDCFIFTLGLTECWLDRETEVVYPMCPGTVAGRFDPTRHVFHNLTVEETKADLATAFALMRRANPNMKCLLTVSPVPITATATGEHVLPAMMYTKCALRAAAGEFAASNPDVDYLPTFELVFSPPMRGAFYEPNMRAVSPAGVEFAMRQFIRGLGVEEPPADGASATRIPDPEAPQDRPPSEDDLVCEDILLEAEAKLR